MFTKWALAHFFLEQTKKEKMLNRGLDKLELLRIVDAVANEKSIDKELVIGSMESAIQKAALTKVGADNKIEVVIDRESGDIKIQKVLQIVESVEDPAREISLDNAKKIRDSIASSIEKQDEEHRVWYVGVTRSAQNLYILKSKKERNGYNL